MDRGIKELLELLLGLESLARFGGLVSADGKVDASDLQHVMSLALETNKLKEAGTGLSEALKEAKDLDESESAQLLAGLYKVAAAWNAAHKSGQ